MRTAEESQTARSRHAPQSRSVLLEVPPWPILTFASVVLFAVRTKPNSRGRNGLSRSGPLRFLCVHPLGKWPEECHLVPHLRHAETTVREAVRLAPNNVSIQGLRHTNSPASPAGFSARPE